MPVWLGNTTPLCSLHGGNGQRKCWAGSNTHQGCGWHWPTSFAWLSDTDKNTVQKHTSAAAVAISATVNGTHLGLKKVALTEKRKAACSAKKGLFFLFCLFVLI